MTLLQVGSGLNPGTNLNFINISDLIFSDFYTVIFGGLGNNTYSL